MKRILGLDLGTNSIGWAVISTDDNDNLKKIDAIGSRIIPYFSDDADEFSKGQAISKNKNRTAKRTQRKGYDRYQQRRSKLTNILRHLNMLPDERLINLPVLELWKLRADAATKGKQLSLPEIGRVLYHLNQKRGYKHAKADETNEDKKQKEYVANVNQRFAHIQGLQKTIGQFFYENLKATEIVNEKGVFYTYRIKEQVFPRKAYQDEFDQIIGVQKEFYPNILTDEIINEIRNKTIYYQRPLKSCKHLVALCEFEKKAYKNKEGKIIFDGPKVAPRTSPLFQLDKMWEAVNNLKLKNRKGEEFEITAEHRQAMFDYLDNNEKLTLTELYNILKIKKTDGWWGGKAIGRGLQGNTTKMQLTKALEGFHNAHELLQFDLVYTDTQLVDRTTGEIIKKVDSSCEQQPFYQLWHTVYSISDKNELTQVLKKKFGIEDEQIVQNLYALDFVKPGYGNKSAKAIRRILPYLQEGRKYNEACAIAGFRHSESLTIAENQARQLLETLPQIQKNTLRQPVVEKILNQMINILNALMNEYGRFDEMRIELARELKQSREERNMTDKNMRVLEKSNKEYKTRIEEMDTSSSRSRIQKYRLWLESQQKCFYCGQTVQAKEFLEGDGVEVEHIIPRSLYPDNSFANKVCACRSCNAEKNNRTAFDYMQSKSEEEFNNYLIRIESYFKDKKISKTKRDFLLTPKEKIPTDFVDRQLREAQYIAKKSKEILQQVCRNVYATSGGVTELLRRVWGYDDVLHDLNLRKYKLGDGLTEIKEFEHRGQKHEKERIKNWSKRLDHRHHAIDALVVALTKQGIIQRLNNLNTERDAMFAEVGEQSQQWKDKYSLLEKWINKQQHFSVDQVKKEVDKVLISFKAGKKVASTGKRIVYKKGKKIVLQENIIIPRGPLSEESVYGTIKTIQKNKSIKYIFENSDLIVQSSIKALVKERLETFEGDIKKAIASLKKSPIYLDAEKQKILEYASCYESQYVKKYNVIDLEAKNIDDIVDEHIRKVVKNRLEECGNNAKEAFKDLTNNPIYSDANHRIPIKSVRCFTGLSAVEPVKSNEEGTPIGFVKPGNNHHIAIYVDKEGKKQEHIATFWHAVERKKYGIPVVITNPSQMWEQIQDRQDLPESFLQNLPNPNWIYETSLQQNEMFILGMQDEEFEDAIRNQDYSTLHKHLYRVQKITHNDYHFRLHTETKVDDKYGETKNQMLSKKIGILKVIHSFGSLEEQHPHKVQITLLGKIKVV